MKRRTFLIGTAAAGAVATAARAEGEGPAEKPNLTLGVGGKPVLYYLPLTIAERRGFFKEAGLNVDIQDFAGGGKALQALIGGSVDVVTGAYEHTIRMQAKGQDVRAVCELGRFPGIVLGIRKDLAGKIKSVADLKGAKIGVTTPGSSTALMTQYAMVKAGLKPTDAAMIGVGATASAIAALRSGEIDAISNAEPVISKLEQDGEIVLLFDTRTEAGTRALFGGSNPAAVLYAKGEFIERYPRTMQHLVNVFRRTLAWIASATPDEIADTVPPAYHLGDRALYVQAVRKSVESYSRTGRLDEAGMRSVLDMVTTLDPEMANAKVDLSKTYDPRFLKG